MFYCKVHAVVINTYYLLSAGVMFSAHYCGEGGLQIVSIIV